MKFLHLNQKLQTLCGELSMLNLIFEHFTSFVWGIIFVKFDICTHFARFWWDVKFTILHILQN